ncbi:MAG: sulfite exporter TauE/SafE family protein [Gammaproteobacteria bacterium]|nr:sulfite exporter TauE/SafE family protein [Gammaproteobacteria bacterium]
MDTTFPLAQLGLSLTAGSLTTLSPCVLPLLPLVVGGAMQANRWAPVAMGLGMSLSFALLGAVVGLFGPALGIDGDGLRVVGSWLLIALALVLLVPALSRRFSTLMTPIASLAGDATARLRGNSLSGAFALGALLGMVWSPCSGPLLAAALTLVASEGQAGQGALLLGLFGLGAALPLIAAGYASRRGFGRLRDWALSRAERVKRVFGVVMGGLGLAILTGGDKWLEARILELLPDSWVLLSVAV